MLPSTASTISIQYSRYRDTRKKLTRPIPMAKIYTKNFIRKKFGQKNGWKQKTVKKTKNKKQKTESETRNGLPLFIRNVPFFPHHQTKGGHHPLFVLSMSVPLEPWIPQPTDLNEKKEGEVNYSKFEWERKKKFKIQNPAVLLELLNSCLRLQQHIPDNVTTDTQESLLM